MVCKIFSCSEFRENPHYLIFYIRENNISTNKQPKQLAKLIVEIALSLKSNSFDVRIKYENSQVSETTIINEKFYQQIGT